MHHTPIDIGVARQIANYSDGVEVAPNLRWMFSSGTPGLSLVGDLPHDITGQAEIAWAHVVHMLEKVNMGVGDIVKATHYLTRAEDIAAYGKVRTKYLGDAKPASMLLIIPQLVRPEFLVEVEIVAARA